MAKFYSYEKVVDTVLSPERLYAFNRLANARSGKVLSVVATPEDQCYTHTDWWIGTSINLGRDFYKSLWDLDTKISISDIRDTYKHIGYTYVGVFYHELGHVLFTDMDFMFNLLRKYSDNFRYFAKQVSNILEDVTIEGSLVKRYPHIQNYFDVLNSAHTRDKVLEAIKENKDDYDFRLNLAYKAFSMTASYDAMISRYFASISSKSANLSLSISSTPITLPSLPNIGTTISERERELQAMCPGKSSTSGTTIVLRIIQAVPHTPFP